MSFRPLISVDFDGVIHSYTSGWQGASNIPDPPVPGAVEWLCDNRESFRIAIFSTRSRHPFGRWAMKSWLADHLREMFWQDVGGRSAKTDDSWEMGNDMAHEFARRVIRELEWPWFKPSAWLTIDDRALTFTGRWEDFTAESIRSFKPWNKP